MKNLRVYPLFSACGLNCGLCPRYHTEGESRCPGCLGKDFYKKHPVCGVLSCCLRHEIEYCCLCSEYPCKKYQNADKTDSFISHKNQFEDFEKAKTYGFVAYEAELNEKVTILNTLLHEYNDGRRKNFYCIAMNLLPLFEIKGIMKKIDEEIARQDSEQKEKVKQIVALFKAKAKEQNLELILRKK